MERRAFAEPSPPSLSASRPLRSTLLEPRERKSWPAAWNCSAVTLFLAALLASISSWSASDSNSES
eukprot:13936964-Alexandrium_andersonii.AAC.1